MKLFAVFLASVAMAIPVAAQVQADTVDASIPTQLPRTAIPHHYAITVTPHAQRLTFDGTVAIDLAVTKPTNELVLNAADLTLGPGRPQATGEDQPRFELPTRHPHLPARARSGRLPPRHPLFGQDQHPGERPVRA